MGYYSTGEGIFCVMSGYLLEVVRMGSELCEKCGNKTTAKYGHTGISICESCYEAGGILDWLNMREEAA